MCKHVQPCAGQAEPQRAGGRAQGHLPRRAPRPGQVPGLFPGLVILTDLEPWLGPAYAGTLNLNMGRPAAAATPCPLMSTYLKHLNLHAGVEVSPGVFKDVPAELHRREEYVYAHTPTGTPGGEVGQAQRSTHRSGANNTCSSLHHVRHGAPPCRWGAWDGRSRCNGHDLSINRS